MTLQVRDAHGIDRDETEGDLPLIVPINQIGLRKKLIDHFKYPKKIYVFQIIR